MTPRQIVTDKARAARDELERILNKEATHAALESHFILPADAVDLTFHSPLVTLRKSLRRVLRILDGRTRQ